MGIDEDEASLLQADLKLNPKVDDEEYYTPSKDEKSKYDRSSGERHHDNKDNGKSRVDTYTREMGKRGGDYEKDMSDYAHAKEETSYASAKHEKSKYDNYPGKRDRSGQHDGESRSDTYAGEMGKRGPDYGKGLRDYAYPNDKKTEYDRNHGKILPEKNYHGRSHVSTRADYKDNGDFGEVKYGEGLNVHTSDYANAKEEKSDFDNYHDKPDHEKNKYIKNRANAYAKDDKSVGNYKEVKYGEDYNVETGDYAPAKEIKYKDEVYYVKRAKPWKSRPKWKQYIPKKGRNAKHRKLRTLHKWMLLHP